MNNICILIFMLISNNMAVAQSLINITAAPSSFSLKTKLAQQDIIEDCEQFEKMVHDKDIDDFIFFRQTLFKQSFNIRYEFILKLEFEDAQLAVASHFMVLPDGFAHFQLSRALRNLKVLADDTSYTMYAKTNNLPTAQVYIYDTSFFKIDKRDLVCDLLKNKAQIYADVDYQLFLSEKDQKYVSDFIESINAIYEKINLEQGSAYLKAVKLGVSLSPLFKEPKKVNNFLQHFMQKNNLIYSDQPLLAPFMYDYFYGSLSNIQLKVVFND